MTNGRPSLHRESASTGDGLTSGELVLAFCFVSAAGLFLWVFGRHGARVVFDLVLFGAVVLSIVGVVVPRRRSGR